jgi:hypothetical protein
LPCGEISTKAFATARHQEAKRKGRELALYDTYQVWFRKTYFLPPNDPRLLALTQEEIETEYWAQHYYQHGTHEQEDIAYEDDEFDALLEAMESNTFNPEEWEDLIGVENILPE